MVNNKEEIVKVTIQHTQRMETDFKKDDIKFLTQLFEDVGAENDLAIPTLCALQYLLQARRQGAYEALEVMKELTDLEKERAEQDQKAG